MATYDGAYLWGPFPLWVSFEAGRERAELSSVDIARVLRARIPRCSMCRSRMGAAPSKGAALLCAGCRQRRVLGSRTHTSWQRRISQWIQLALISGPC